MQGLILGIDLCDDYCQVGYYNPQSGESDSLEIDNDNSYMIPTVICKVKNTNEWEIGEAAYRCALTGQGTTVDKLVSLCMKNGTSTIEGVKYSATQLMGFFLVKLVNKIKDNMGENSFSKVMITSRNNLTEAFDCIKEAALLAGIPEQCLHFATHSETYLYYVISQKPDVYTNMACLFDISDNGMEYYELTITRGRRPQIAEVLYRRLEEGFSIDILDTVQGKKIADKILCSCSERILGRRVVTSIFLTGRAFDTENWADTFINVMCSKRRVFLGQGLFAQGAAYMAAEYDRDESRYPYVCICRGRLANRVTITADYCGQTRQIIAAEAGRSWRDSGLDADFILDDADKFEFNVSGLKMPWQKRLQVSLADFPKRPNKTTRINVRVWFEDDNIMKTEITDMGFGEFYPPSGKKVVQEFRL